MTTDEATWTATECAAAWGVGESTWRDAVANGHAPKPLPGFDEQRRRRWDPADVTGWPRQVAATVAEMAALLLTLTADHGPTVPRTAIRAEWLATYPEHGDTQPVNPQMQARRANRQGPRSDGRAHTAGTAARKRISGALSKLETAGAVRRDGTTAVVVLDAAMLAELADSPDVEARP